jgi:hypothetical protein
LIKIKIERKLYFLVTILFNIAKVFENLGYIQSIEGIEIFLGSSMALIFVQYNNLQYKLRPSYRLPLDVSGPKNVAASIKMVNYSLPLFHRRQFSASWA